MTACHLCGVDRPTETLGFDHRDRPDTDDVWRIASVCEKCRRARLMPALRALFDGDGHNIGDAPDSAWEPADPAPDGALFRSFRSDAGTVHVVGKAEAHVVTGEHRCIARCGVRAHAEPEPRDLPLDAKRDGETICLRCARSAPRHVSDAAGGAGGLR